MCLHRTAATWRSLHPPDSSDAAIADNARSRRQSVSSVVGPLETRMRIQVINFLILMGALGVGCASDRTRGESSVCEIHHARMTKTNVPILGSPAIGQRDLARYTAAAKAFPHADEWAGGSCIGPSVHPSRAIIYTCSACKAARQQWEQHYDAKQ